MKFWNLSLIIGIISFSILLAMSILPNNYNAFSWSALPHDAAKTLFPVMTLSWVLALAAIAINNVFLDKCYITHNIHLSWLKKYLPSLLSMPALFSFAWFCLRYYRFFSVTNTMAVGIFYH